MAKKETKPKEEEKVKLKAKPEDEDEDKCNKSDDEEDETEKEAEADEDDEEDVKKKKKKKEAEADMDEEDETEKGELGGENPAEQAQAGASAGNTISPNAGVPSTQNVFVPSSGTSVGRNASGSTPSETHYSGKSANTDLAKSPLFLELSKQMNELQKAFEKKLDAIEKSINDRVANISKTANKIADFYDKSPMYKALGAEEEKKKVQKSLSERIALGEIKYQ